MQDLYMHYVKTYIFHFYIADIKMKYNSATHNINGTRMFNIEEVINFSLIILYHQRDSIISFAQIHPALLLKYPRDWKRYDKNGEMIMRLLDANGEKSRDEVLLCVRLNQQVDELRHAIKRLIKKKLGEHCDLHVRITRACCEYLFGCALSSDDARMIGCGGVASPLVARYYKNIQTDEGFERPLMINEAAMLITRETIPTQRDIDFIRKLRANDIIAIYDIMEI